MYNFMNGEPVVIWSIAKLEVYKDLCYAKENLCTCAYNHAGCALKEKGPCLDEVCLVLEAELEEENAI